MTKKNNDWLSLMLLGGLGIIAYYLFKNKEFSLWGGGGGGSYSPPPNGELPPTSPPIPPGGLTIGLLAEKPIMNTKQEYAFVGQNKDGYQQKTIMLTTTPAMRYPQIVQSRGIIKETAKIDIGQIVNSITDLRNTPIEKNTSSFAHSRGLSFGTGRVGYSSTIKPLGSTSSNPISPAIVQSRYIVQKTTHIDVPKLMTSIYKMRRLTIK